MPSSHQLLEEAQRDLKTKAFASAQSKAHSVVKTEPNNGGAWHILGLVAIEENNLSEAIGFFKKAVAVQPKANYYFNLGIAHRRMNQLPQAIEAYRACLKLEPKMVRAWANLGNAYRVIKDNKQALKCYKRTIELDPKNSITHYNMGIVYHLDDHLDEAIKAYRRAIKYNPDNAKAYCNLGTIYSKLRRYEKAVSNYQQALKIDPLLFDAYNNYGSTLIEVDQLNQAESLLRKALKLQPDSVQTLRNMTLCKTYTNSQDKDAQYIQKLLEKPNLSQQESMHLYFALGKIYEDCHKTDRAFHYYQKANALHYKQHPFNIFNLLDYTNQIIQIFDQSFIHENRHAQVSKIHPLIIVGAPRSGKSLLEKLLKTHPEIEGAGEVGLAEFANFQPRGNRQEPYPQWCLTITEDEVKQICHAYENKLLRDTTVKTYLIDTMPGNAYYCGLFALLFPEAKFIYMERDALDLSLKMFFKYFVNKHFYTYNLKVLGQYTRIFQYMMTHWEKTLGKQFLKIQYEDLVKQPEAMLKKIGTFLELEASFQVGVDLNKDEIQFSRAYETYLEPLKQGLSFDPTTNKNQIHDILKHAAKKHQSRAYEEAAKLYRYVLQLDPDNPIAIHLLGVVAFETGKSDKAIELIQKALELNPHYMQAHANLATIYEHLGQEDKAKVHQHKAHEISIKLHSQLNKQLSQEHREKLMGVLSKPFKVVKEYERKILIAGDVPSNKNESALQSSNPFHFRDLSYGSYRLGGTMDEPLDRLQSWHFLFKSLAIVEHFFNHEKDTIHVLEVGCAKGALRRLIEGNVSPSDEKSLFYWGIDSDKSKLQAALSEVTNMETGAAGNFMPSAFMHHAVGQGLPFKDETLDAIVCLELLKYLPIDVGMQLIYEMHRVLMPGGMVYLVHAFDVSKRDLMMGMSFEDLKEIVLKKGFIIKGEYGSQASPEHVLGAIEQDFQPLVDKLCDYHPPGVVSTLLAPLYPDAGAERVLHLMKKEL